MKLTIPSPQNIKRREAFMFAHPDYYKEIKLRAELLKIAFIRAEKNLRWNKPINPLRTIQQETKEFVLLPIQKLTLMDKLINVFNSQRGN